MKIICAAGQDTDNWAWPSNSGYTRSRTARRRLERHVRQKAPRVNARREEILAPDVAWELHDQAGR